jgi:hypothetical protein
MKRVALSCLAALAGCAHDEPGQTIVVHPSPIVLEAHGGSSAMTTRSEPSRIQVLPSKRPDRPAEVVGVVDAHVAMGDHDRALAVLREKAAALGADAVIGVDFAHGEGHGGQPIHLSGLAIRYLERPLAAD